MASDFERVASAPAITKHFRIVDRVGSGGFSNVFKAECVSKKLEGQYVALKVIKTTCQASRVEREIECLHLVKGSPRAANMLAIVRHDDLPILVLQYIPHGPISVLSSAELTRETITQVMFELFSAIAYVHERGIVHRDVKPSNFLFAPGATGCLVDFGLARRIAADDYMFLTAQEAFDKELEFCSRHAPAQPDLVCVPEDAVPEDDDRKSKRWNRAGTRGYRAPEVLLQCTYQSAAIDMFSAGVIALGLLSHRTPFFPAEDDLTCLAEYIAVFGFVPFKDFAAALDKELDVEFGADPPDEIGVAHDLEAFCTRLRCPDDAPLSFPKEFYDLVRGCLSIDSRFRLTAAQALAHPFFQQQQQQHQHMEM